MDPYLESPDLWPDVHLNVLVGIGEQLTRTLRPRYVGRIKLTTFTVEPNDPAKLFYTPHGGVMRPRSQEPFSALHRQIEVRRPAADRVVTVIEITCPWSKLAGARGREVLDEKRRAALASGVSWLEIDLLRDGGRTGQLNESKLPASAYRVFLDRGSDNGLRRSVWPVDLRCRLPVLPVPLAEEAPDAQLDLQPVLDAAYDGAAYHLDADYTRGPAPPLDSDDAAWADALLRAKGLRN